LLSVGATSLAGCAKSADRRWTAAQIRATAALRSVNFFTGFSSVKGATPREASMSFHVALRHNGA
jgi:hypothetical protein